MTESPSIVWLHGFAGAPRMWRAAQREVRRAGVSARARTPRLPGHGRAPWAVPGAFDDVARAFAVRVRARGAWIVGYSMGARVALAMAACAPWRVAGLVLVGVNAGFGPRAAKARAARREWEARVARGIERDGLAAFARAWEMLPLFATERDLSAAVRRARRAERRDHTPRGVAWSMRTLGLATMPDLAPDLAVLAARVPVHLVAGARDPKFTRIARTLARRAPGAVVHVVEGAGHNVALENPRALGAIVARAYRAAHAAEE
jgi:2-succinyl-6-hydroxy-2,4-cyclohexadiene-1-carboxylate synthase